MYHPLRITTQEGVVFLHRQLYQWTASALLLCSSVAGAAQPFLEIRAGTNSNVVHLSESVNIELASRINVLGTMSVAPGFWWSRRWGTEVAVQYAAKGYDDLTYKGVLQTTGSYKSAGFRFHHIECMPRLLWRWKEGVTLAAGGYGGYLFKRQYRDPGVAEWQRLDTSFDGFFRNFEAGLAAGLHISHQYGLFFFQYQYGLYPFAVFQVTQESTEKTVQMQNRTFIVGLGFHLARRN